MNFIINRWVRGDDFHGRQDLLEAIKERQGKPTWVLGNRRVGKTSLLRQIEWLCRQEEWKDTLGLYWDLQGAGSTEGLKDAFLEALEDNEDLADEVGLDIDALEAFSFVDMLNKFRRKVKSLKDKHFLLLIDECEELVDVAQDEPAILAPFRKLSQGTRSLTIIMAGSYRMTDLDESDSRTSLFLPDFLPPLLLKPFTQEVAVNLLQGHGLSESAATQVYQLTLGNPHLLQVLGEHVHRTQNLETALAELKHHKVAHYYFQSNFQCLPEAFRHCWKETCALKALNDLSDTDPNIPYLQQSGIIRMDTDAIAPAPLIYMEEADLPIPEVIQIAKEGTAPASKPIAQVAPKAPPTPPPTPAQKTASGFLGFIENNDFQEAPTTSSFEELANTSSESELHQHLDSATPEFIQGEPANPSTSVYLAGLHYYRKLFAKGLFREIQDPFERAEAISERNVALSRSDLDRVGLESKEAMVLLRSLKAKPSQRYVDLDALKADLT